MAFRYDKLSCGYHPDFCSPCSTNACHGRCICEPQIPAPGLLCEACGGTGCPRCSCIPAPQQTFLSHSRVSFPKCSCEPYPKKCGKCCRKRIACDSLPSDVCDTGEAEAFCPSDDEGDDVFDEDMLVDIVEENMDISCQSQMEIKENINNFNNNTEPLEKATEQHPDEPMEFEPTSTANRKSKFNKRKPKRRTSKVSVPWRRRASRSPRLRRVKVIKSKAKKPCCDSCGDGGECESTMVTKTPSHHNQNDVEFEDWLPAGDNYNESASLTDVKAKLHEVVYPDSSALTNKVNPNLQPEVVCRVTQKDGPCDPKPAVKAAEEFTQGKPTCMSDCEKPCLPDSLLDPCNPKTSCICNKTCKKEFCMLINDKCVRCAPREDTLSSKCIPCTKPKFVKPKKHVDKDPCDDSQECEDPCTELFGTCTQEHSCIGECNTGECENACSIM